VEVRGESRQLVQRVVDREQPVVLDRLVGDPGTCRPPRLAARRSRIVSTTTLRIALPT
jgi:hypothetical protein